MADDRSSAPLRLPRTPPWLGIRLPFIAFALIVIVAGLTVHRYGQVLSPTVRDVLGDALWAAMIAAWIGAASPRIALWRRSVVALVVCVAIELSQRYHSPAIDAIRATTIGRLVLGSDYDTRDLAAYALGVLAATLFELAARRRSRMTHSKL